MPRSHKQVLTAIGGSAVFDDASARDVQLAEMRGGFGPAKARHFVNAVSSVVVPADELLPHIDAPRSEVRINDRVVVKTSTATNPIVQEMT